MVVPKNVDTVKDITILKSNLDTNIFSSFVDSIFL